LTAVRSRPSPSTLNLARLETAAVVAVMVAVVAVVAAGAARCWRPVCELEIVW
jgi:hypothetical protein